MSDPSTSEFPVDWLRQTSPYINTHRGKTFVIWLSGASLNHANFSHLIHDLTLLSHLGVRLILVHGMRPQIDKELAALGIKPKFIDPQHPGTNSATQNSVRVTGNDVLPALKIALGNVRCQFESAFSTGLPNTPMSGARITLCSGNFVVAQPYGVREGIDYGHTGEVRRVRASHINQLLDLNHVVLLSPVGYSPTGELFNLHSEDVATQTAIHVEAQKLIFLHDRATGITEGSVHEISSRNLDSEQSLPPELQPLKFVIGKSLHACQQGVKRCHIVNSQQDGALLKELFTRDGSGLLIDSGHYDNIRAACTSDIAGIKVLINPLIENGMLRDRTEQDLEREVQNFYVAEREGSVIGCASLTLFGKQAELGCLAVHPDFRASGKAAEILKHIVKEARKKQCSGLFALSTRSGDWFQEQGFVPDNIDNVPATRENMAKHKKRGSKLFTLEL